MIKYFEDLLNERSLLERSIGLEMAKRLAGSLLLEPLTRSGDVATVEKQETVEKIRQENERLKEEIQALESQAAVFSEQTARIKDLIEKVNADVVRLQQDTARLHDEIHQLQLEKEKRISVVDRFLKPYTAGLGLQFSKVTDSVWVITLDLNPTNSGNTQVKIHIRLNEDKSFEVTMMEPKHSEADNLLNKLRTTNNIRGFISGIRSLYTN